MSYGQGVKPQYCPIQNCLNFVCIAAVSWSGGAMSGLGLVPAGLTCAAAWLRWPASLWVPAGVLYLLCCTLSCPAALKSI